MNRTHDRATPLPEETRETPDPGRRAARLATVAGIAALSCAAAAALAPAGAPSIACGAGALVGGVLFLLLLRPQDGPEAESEEDLSVVSLGAPFPTDPEQDLPHGVERRGPFLQSLRGIHEAAALHGEPLALVVLSLTPDAAVRAELESDPALLFVIGVALRRAVRASGLPRRTPRGLPTATIGALGRLDFAVGLRGMSAAEGRAFARVLRLEVLDEVEGELSRELRRGLTARTTVVGTDERGETFEELYARANRMLSGALGGAPEADPASPEVALSAGRAERSAPPEPPPALPSTAGAGARSRGAADPDAWLARLVPLLASGGTTPLQRLAWLRIRANLAFLEYSRIDAGITRLGDTQVFTHMDLFAQGFAEPGRAGPPDEATLEAMLAEVRELAGQPDRSVLEDIALRRIRAAVEFVMEREGEPRAAEEEPSEEELALELDGFVLGQVA